MGLWPLVVGAEGDLPWLTRSQHGNCLTSGQIAPRGTAPGAETGNHASRRSEAALPFERERDQYGPTGIERRGAMMSVYRVIDVVGTSASSWEDAAREAISTAAGSLHDLRIAEVTKQDVVVHDDGTLLFRSRIQLSFKYAPE